MEYSPAIPELRPCCASMVTALVKLYDITGRDGLRMDGDVDSQSPVVVMYIEIKADKIF